MADEVKEQELTEQSSDAEWREAIAKAEKPEEKAEKSSEEKEVEGSDDEDKDSESEEPKSEGPAIQENKRLRQQNREFREELDSLRKRVENLSMPNDEPNKKEDRLKTATVEELLDAEATLEQKLLEAYQGGDSQLVSQLSEAKKKVKRELISRPNKEASTQAKKEKAISQFKALTEDISKEYPALADKSSSLYKQAAKYYQDNLELMEQLGEEMGSYFSVLASIAKKPAKGKEEKQEKKDVIKEMEKIVEHSTSRTPNTRTPKETGAISVSATSDADFDALWNDLKMGKVQVAQLGK